MAFKYLRPEDVRRLESYEFAARLLAEGWLSGRHRSRLRGASTEFHEYRPYSPGDDPALVDWRVYARSDRHYLKTFEQETNLECHLLVDSSSSMGFAGGAALTKLEFASYFAAALAWLVVRGSDRVSLQLFDDRIREFLPPGSTRQHLHQLLASLERNHPRGPTSLATALARASLHLRRRGTVIILSDFYDEPAAVFQALNPFIHRGFRIHLFHLLSPEEMELGDGTLARYEDLETSETLTLHPKAVAEGYRDALHTHITRLRTLSAQRQIDYAIARTDGTFWPLFDRVGVE
ncbi:MAG: hypothetical protein QOE70_2576 [Chthoniobacter sp.]|jgi:uncharacterized protein (DUF58 family)|nr:hypothetical protein [Chthoniobacter sp.]